MRQEFSKETKRAAWTRCKGYCEECDIEIDPNIQKPEYDHNVACAMGGDNSLENCVVRCVGCHKRKTFTKDIPAIAKAKRIEEKALGLRQPKGRPMPGTRASGFRKRMDGTVERW